MDLNFLSSSGVSLNKVRMVVDSTKPVAEISVEGFYISSVKWTLECLNPTVTLDTAAIVKPCNQPATEVCNISPFAIPIPETYSMNATFTLYNPQLGAMKDYIKTFTFTVIKNNFVRASIDRYASKYSPQDLVFSGRNSYDPNTNQFQFFNLVSKSLPNNGLAYAWTLTLAPPAGSILTASTEEFLIPQATLTIGNSYTVSLTVTKDTRSDTKSFTFQVVDPAVTTLPVCGLSVETKPFSNLYNNSQAEKLYVMSSRNPTIEALCKYEKPYTTMENKLTYLLSTPVTSLGSDVASVPESLMLNNNKYVAGFETETFIDGVSVSKTTFELGLAYPINSTYVRFFPNSGTEFSTIFNVRFLIDLTGYFISSLNMELTFVDTVADRAFLVYKGNSLGEKLVYLPQGSGYLMLSLYDGQTWLGNTYSANLTVKPATQDELDKFVNNIWNIDDRFRGNYINMVEEIYAGQFASMLSKLGKRDLAWSFSRSADQSKLTSQSSAVLLQKLQELEGRRLDEDWIQDIHPIFESANDLTSEYLLSSSLAVLANPWLNNTQNLYLRNSSRTERALGLLSSFDKLSDKLPHSVLLSSLSTILGLLQQGLSQARPNQKYEGNSIAIFMELVKATSTIQTRQLQLGTEATINLKYKQTVDGVFWMRALRSQFERPYARFVPITPIVEFGFGAPGAPNSTTAVTPSTNADTYIIQFSVSRYDALRGMGGERADNRFTFSCLSLDKIKKVYRNDLCKNTQLTTMSAEIKITCECTGANYVVAGYIQRANLIMPGTETNIQMPSRVLDELVTSEFFYSSVYFFYVTMFIIFFVVGASMLIYVDTTNPPFYARAELEASFLSLVQEYNKVEQAIVDYETSEEQRIFNSMQRKVRAKVLGESSDDAANLHHAMVAYEADKKIERIKKKFGLVQKKPEAVKEKDKFSEYGIVDTERGIQSEDEVDQLRDEDDEEAEENPDSTTKKRKRNKEEMSKDQEAIYIGELDSSDEEFLEQYNNARAPEFFKTMVISFIVNHSFFGMFLDNSSNEPKYIQYGIIWVRVFVSYCYVSAFNAILPLADCSMAFYIMSFMWVMLSTQISFNLLKGLISFYIQKRIAGSQISAIQPQVSQPAAGAASPSLPKKKPQSKLFIEVGVFLLFLNAGLYLICLIKDLGITKRQMHTVINHHLIVIPTEFIFAEFLVLCCRFFFLVLLFKFPDSKESLQRFVVSITPSQMLLTVSDLLNLPSPAQLKYALLLKDTRS